MALQNYAIEPMKTFTSERYDIIERKIVFAQYFKKKNFGKDVFEKYIV